MTKHESSTSNAELSDLDGGLPSEASEGASTKEPAVPHILVIEDNDLVRDVVVNMLRSMRYRVSEAASGSAGLEIVQQQKPTLAIFDLVLPDSDGAEVARIARLLHPSIGVIFLSGYFDSLASEQVGGALSLRKPVNMDTLGRAVKKLLPSAMS